MSEREKILQAILCGQSDANISFVSLRKVLLGFGFTERVCGSHRIFTREGIAEIINLQPIGAQAKPYQVKQVRGIILKYRLGGRQA